MRRKVLSVALAVAAALVVGATDVADVRAGGYYNLPGNFCQCVGHGFGAGYHAPLILGPPRCCECCTYHVVRLPYAPSSCACSCCCRCGGSFAEPSSMEGYVSTRAVPAPAPAVVTPKDEVLSEPAVPAADAPAESPEAAAASILPTDGTTIDTSTDPPTIAPATDESTVAPSTGAETIYAPASDAERPSEPTRPLFDAPIQP